MARRKEFQSSFLDMTASEFASLSDSKAQALLKVEGDARLRQALHAYFGIFLGTVTYLASLGACIYLAMHGFPKLAAIALGTPVLTVIKRIIDSRI
jgi:hypothetical protein